MTNKDKFLRDGVSVEEFIQKLTNHINKTQKSTYEKIKEFLEQPAQILTEDERVILRNIDKKYYKICRDEDNNVTLIQKLGEYDGTMYADEFNHLFQFIKERRRI